MDYSLEELMAEKQRRTTSKTQPQADQPQGQDIQALLSTALGQNSPLAPAMNYSKRLIGESPEKIGGNDDLSKLYAQEAIKKQFEDPIDKQLQQDYKRAATERALRDPFYMTPQGQEYYQAGTFQRQQTGKQAGVETGLMQDFQDKLQSGQPVPVGTTQQAGPYNVPLNPKLDESQTNVISGVNKYVPMVDRLEQLVNGGALEGTGHKLMAEYGNKSLTGRYLTPNNTPIEELASISSEIQKYMFSEGGKTLSPTEKSIVNSGLTFAGKSNEQIKHDFNEAIQILRLKKDIIFGGMNAAQQQQPITNTINTNTQNNIISDEEAYQEYLKVKGGR